MQDFAMLAPMMLWVAVAILVALVGLLAPLAWAAARWLDQDRVRLATLTDERRGDRVERAVMQGLNRARETLLREGADLSRPAERGRLVALAADHAVGALVGGDPSASGLSELAMARLADLDLPDPRAEAGRLRRRPRRPAGNADHRSTKAFSTT